MDHLDAWGTSSERARRTVLVEHGWLEEVHVLDGIPREGSRRKERGRSGLLPLRIHLKYIASASGREHPALQT